MTSRSVLALLAVIALGVGAAGCSTISSINPFDKSDDNKVRASEGERIPLIALNQRLEVSEALRDQSFYLPEPQPVPDWQQPGGTPGRVVEHMDAGAQFQVAWRRKFGEGSSRRSHVIAPPVAADGRIYVMDGEAHVSAMDAGTGARIWRVDLAERSKRDSNAFGGGLAYAGGKLFVASGYRFVAAVDAATGAQLWKTRVDAPIHGAPVVTEGRVMVINLEDEMLTFNAETGAADWTYQALSEPARILAASSPAPAGDSVIAAFASGELTALRSASGSEGWTITLSRTSRTNALSEIRDIAGRPVVHQGAVLAGSHSGVFASVDLRTGNPQWTLPVTSISTPWPSGDVVYIVSKGGEVICAARGTGQVFWITELNKGLKRKKRSIYTGPVLASNRLIVVSDRGVATALDPRTGEVKGSIKLGEGSMLSPIAMNGVVYAVTKEATLVAIR